MSYEYKHEQIIKMISSAIPENFLEKLSGVEYLLSSPSTEESKSLVPFEANFQLPNVFLKVKNNFEVEKLFSKTPEGNNWNPSIDEVIEFIDQIETCTTNIPNDEACDVATLEKILKQRYGGN